MYIVHGWPSARDRFLYARLALFAVEWRQGDLQTERMRETQYDTATPFGTIWYLMVQEKQNLVMWRYENDYLRWTLYDPDQKPNTDKFLLWETMAYSATENNCVAIFGTDHLWIYSTRLRVWTRVLSIGNAPSKLTSYATMNSLKNGSLLLFGGTDKTLNSLWMATIDFKRMQATWKRMCCNSMTEVTRACRTTSPVVERNME